MNKPYQLIAKYNKIWYLIYDIEMQFSNHIQLFTILLQSVKWKENLYEIPNFVRNEFFMKNNFLIFYDRFEPVYFRCFLDF